MVHLIDKDEAVSRIKRRIDELNDHAASYSSNSEHDYLYRIEEEIYKNSISIIDSLEVKEIDLEKEIQEHIKGCLDIKFPTSEVGLIKKDVAYTARKFFELGLKTQKGE